MRRGEPAWLAANPIGDIPLIAELDFGDKVRYKLLSTPQTVVLNSQGAVEQIWVGALMGHARQEAESYFDLPLPGVKLD